MHRPQGRSKFRDNQRERDKENYDLNLIMIETKRRSSLKQSLLDGMDRVWAKDRQQSDQGQVNRVKREQLKMERQGDRYRRRAGRRHSVAWGEVVGPSTWYIPPNSSPSTTSNCHRSRSHSRKAAFTTMNCFWQKLWHCSWPKLLAAWLK